MHTNLRSAFTLLELLVVVIIISILAALIAPQLSSAADDAKVAKILSVADTLRVACQSHYSHTGQLARESSNSTVTNQHELSLTQVTAGWKGPYLDHPVSTSDNPFEAIVILYQDFNGPAAGGFDLMGTGANSVTGLGQYVEFRNVPQAVGQAIDDALDGGIGGAWDQSGRVKWLNNRVLIFLMDIPG